MTSNTRFTGSAVIKHHICPVNRVVTNIAGFRRHNVVDILGG